MRRYFLIASLLLVAAILAGCAISTGMMDYKHEVSSINAQFISIMTEYRDLVVEVNATQPNTIDEEERVAAACTKALGGIRPLLSRVTEMKPPSAAEKFHTQYVSYYEMWVSLLTEDESSLDYDVQTQSVQRAFDSVEEPAWQAMVAATQKQPMDLGELKGASSAYLDVWSLYSKQVSSLTPPRPMLAAHVRLSDASSRLLLDEQAVLNTLDLIEQGQMTPEAALAVYQQEVSQLQSDLDKVQQARVSWTEAYSAEQKDLDARRLALYQQQFGLSEEFDKL